ncbi:protein E14 [Proboscivirus elephantidbeta4]|uniref:Protein E14 n=1 Tax=Elephant endotheliotropic herpesvirus 4 TaxID=548914 RepID=A0A0S1TP37_9BETA|nr:protein E14 [Elephant endotheliotropic herpesvirus 4]ALM25949.1 protein E14 [Elephant endotheliotropic herpesvirus 4]
MPPVVNILCARRFFNGTLNYISCLNDVSPITIFRDFDVILFLYVVNVALFCFACLGYYRRQYGLKTVLNPLLCLVCIGLVGYLNLPEGPIVPPPSDIVDVQFYIFVSTLVASATSLFLMCAMSMCKHAGVAVCMANFCAGRIMILFLGLTLWLDFDGIADWGSRYRLENQDMIYNLVYWVALFVVACLIMDIFSSPRDFWDNHYDVPIYIYVTWYMHVNPIKHLSPFAPDLYGVVAIVYLFCKKLMNLRCFSWYTDYVVMRFNRYYEVQ